MPLFDLTMPLTAETPVFPGDPPFSKTTLRALEQGYTHHVCHLQSTNHTGTHIDFPSHIIPHGKTSSDFPLSTFVGPGIILEYEENSTGEITLAFIKQQQPLIVNCPRVFFKTPKNPATKKPTHLTKDAAEALVQLGVKIVGVDSLSIDAMDSDHLSVHTTLLSRDVLIVEGLRLIDAPTGKGEIIIAPLHIPHMDGLPARVFMRK